MKLRPFPGHHLVAAKSSPGGAVLRWPSLADKRPNLQVLGVIGEIIYSRQPSRLHGNIDTAQINSPTGPPILLLALVAPTRRYTMEAPLLLRHEVVQWIEMELGALWKGDEALIQDSIGICSRAGGRQEVHYKVMIDELNKVKVKCHIRPFNTQYIYLSFLP